MSATRHLDIGCGAQPRNPYGAEELYALDLHIPEGVPPARFRR